MFLFGQMKEVSKSKPEAPVLSAKKVETPKVEEPIVVPVEEVKTVEDTKKVSTKSSKK